MRKVSIVVPVYNDWASFGMLLEKLNEAARALPASLRIMAVNDGSTESEPEWVQGESDPTWETLERVEIVQLVTNVGHQRAIAIGLCVAVAEHECDAVLVMDADGEDPPEQIGMLLRGALGRKDFCVVAQRRKRTERLTFKLSYLMYKTIFRIVTGKVISFGNFSLISRNYARRLVMTPDLWNNLAAAILRSKLPIDLVPIDRGHRYSGKSKMSFVSLVVHGLSGMSAYGETIYVRLLLLTIAIAALAIPLIPILMAVRIYFPLHATPGWVTTVSFGLVIIFLQIFLTALSSLLTILNNRTERLALPIMDYKPYVAFVRTLAPSGEVAPIQV